MALANESKLVIFTYNSKNMSLAEVLTIDDKITSGIFVNKIFYFSTKAGKINIAFLGKSFFLTNG